MLLARLIWLGMAALLAACAPPVELGKRHAPSQLSSPLPTSDFDAYISPPGNTSRRPTRSPAIPFRRTS